MGRRGEGFERLEYGGDCGEGRGEEPISSWTERNGGIRCSAEEDQGERGGRGQGGDGGAGGGGPVDRYTCGNT